VRGIRWRHGITLTPATQTRLARLQTLLYEALVAADLAYFQPGKTASLSVFPRAGVPLRQVYDEAGRLARDFGGELSLEEAATCVNLIVRGIDKAEGGTLAGA
jgi:hypothetical protein